MPKWFLILVLPVILCAQQGRGPRPWFLDSQVVRDLNISDVQLKQIRQTQKDYRSRMIELRAEVNQAENDLDAAFNDDPVDQVKSNDAINRLANARGELTKTVSQMDLKLRTLLTAQQWQELKKRERTLPGMHRRAPSTAVPPTPTIPNQK